MFLMKATTLTKKFLYKHPSHAAIWPWRPGVIANVSLIPVIPLDLFILMNRKNENDFIALSSTYSPINLCGREFYSISENFVQSL